MSTQVSVSALSGALRGAASALRIASIYLASPSGQAILITDLVDVDDILKAIGVAVPPVAVAANDLSVVIDVAKIGLPVIDALVAATAAASSTPAPGTIEVWGSDFEDPNFSGP